MHSNIDILFLNQVFEKKNQKSAQSILLLQKKLEEYQKKVRELEEHGIHRSSQKIRGLGQGIKSVGGNIRDGISGMSSSVMSKPKELAAHLVTISLSYFPVVHMQ